MTQIINKTSEERKRDKARMMLNLKFKLADKPESPIAWHIRQELEEAE